MLSRARPDHSFADQWQREFKSLVYDVTTSPSASQLTSMFVSQSTKVFHFRSSARPGEQPRPLLCWSLVARVTSCVSDPHTLFLSSSRRYEELLRWAGAALAAQGLDEQAVSQTLAALRQPVEMEEVRREMGAWEEPGGESGPGEGLEEQEEPQTKRSCWYCEG